MHIIWEALNCLLSVMLSVKCHFVNGLYIQTSLAVNCLPATSDHYYHTYVQKWWSGKKNVLYFYIWEVLSHSRECGSRVEFPRGSRMIREGSHIWSLIQLNAVESCLAMSTTKKLFRQTKPRLFFLNGRCALCPAFLKMVVARWLKAFFKNLRLFDWNIMVGLKKHFQLYTVSWHLWPRIWLVHCHVTVKMHVFFIQGNKRGGCVDTTIFDNKLIFNGYF